MFLCCFGLVHVGVWFDLRLLTDYYLVVVCIAIATGVVALLALEFGFYVMVWLMVIILLLWLLVIGFLGGFVYWFVQ